MKTETKLTIDDMVRHAMVECDELTTTSRQGGTTVVKAPPLKRFLLDSALTHGVASVVRQASEADCGIDWLISAVAAWSQCGNDSSASEGFDEDGCNRKAFADYIKRQRSTQVDSHWFYLCRSGNKGAELCIEGEGGFLQPIQRFKFTDFPWGMDHFQIVAKREKIGQQSIWLLMLPEEF